MTPPKQSLICFKGIGQDENNRLGPMTEALMKVSSLFAGKRVLDLGSNAGHFPLVYSAYGAAHVTAVEPRECFYDFAIWELSKLPEGQRISWITADIREFTPDGPHEVVSCLGLIYHLHNGWAHLERIVNQSNAETVILDSMLWEKPGMSIETGRLNTNCSGMVEVVDHPSKASLEGTLDELGWKHELILENWQIPHCLRGMWVCRVRG